MTNVEKARELLPLVEHATAREYAALCRRVGGTAGKGHRAFEIAAGVPAYKPPHLASTHHPCLWLFGTHEEARLADAFRARWDNPNIVGDPWPMTESEKRALYFAEYLDALDAPSTERAGVDLDGDTVLDDETAAMLRACGLDD